MAEGVDAVLIAGPTASGKTGMAVAMARQLGGVVVNADSMQVYDRLSILTARPDPEEMAGVEHRLFGHVSPDRAYSVAEWLNDVSEVLDELKGRGLVPVFAGGTGLYFRALLQGLSEIPEPSAEIRRRWRQFAESRPEELHAELARRDPAGAAVLEPGDRQRIVRALEVVETTGLPISHWQEADAGKGLLAGGGVRRMILEVPSGILHQRIGARFDGMVENGAVAEVRELLELGLPGDLPAMKAIGVPQIRLYLEGEIPLDEAIERAKAATRQYAKRQRTWFRNQAGPEWERVGLVSP